MGRGDKKVEHCGIALINRLKTGLNKADIVSNYHAFIRSHLDYCGTVWSSAAPTHRKAVGISQRRAQRVMANYEQKSFCELYEEFGAEDIERRWREHDAIWLFRIMKADKTVSSHVKDMATFSENSGNLRQRKKIEVVGKSKVIETTFSWRLKCLYEQLPPSIWNAKNVDCFKTLWSTSL